MTPTTSFGSIMSVARNMVRIARTPEQSAYAETDGGERHSLAGHELDDVVPCGAGFDELLEQFRPSGNAKWKPRSPANISAFRT